MSLLDQVRGSCPSGLWAQGVRLARQGVVFEGAADPDDNGAIV